MSKYVNQTLHEEEEEEEEEGYSSSSSIYGEDSDAESCSSDLGDEQTSNENQNQLLASQKSAPMYELSSLMENLPIKKGLSRYYDGKSQSFSSLLEVNCKEDLPKKENPINKRKMKACKSYACGLSDYNPAMKNISKKPPRGSCGNFMAQSNGMNMMC